MSSLIHTPDAFKELNQNLGQLEQKAALPPHNSDRQCRIILIRHGESTSNADGKALRIAGRTHDVLLTEKGIGQAAAAANFLAAILPTKISAVYSSPLKRALQTAEKIKEVLQLNTETIISQDLIETHYGNLEGASKEDYDPAEEAMEKELPELSAFRERVQYKMKKQGTLPNNDMETGEEVDQRIAQFLLNTAKNHPGKTVLAVTHNGPVKYQFMHSAMREYHKEILYTSFSVGNAAFLILDVDIDSQKVATKGTYQMAWKAKAKL
jgi:broad specificity phosphatase PhoE